MSSTIKHTDTIEVEASVDIDFVVYCEECHEELEVSSVDSSPPYYINVARCICKDAELDEAGYERGKEDYSDQ